MTANIKKNIKQNLRDKIDSERNQILIDELKKSLPQSSDMNLFDKQAGIER